MAKRALVLGGGGPVGIGWESGLAAGLEQEGVVLAGADLIVGTSAGSVVGAQLALGRTARDLLATQIALGQGDRATQRQAQGPIDIGALIQNFTKLFTSGKPPEQLRAEIGAFALSAKTMSEEDWLAGFGSMETMGLDVWPERRFVCTAVDTADGSFVAWDRDAGVSLARAVASSCAVPGIFPPVTINGHRYMDGGMRSGTNADLAKDYDIVVVVSVTGSGAMAGRGPFAERARVRLEGEIEGLRAGGSTVELIVPDDASLAAFGPNLMDYTRRGGAAEAGVRQGRAESARLRAVWD
jgi:NTE family protein